jgi:starvation-inducible DNA-binding protein
MYSKGLGKPKSEDLIFSLNELLSNYVIMCQNVWGFYWNIKSQKFFELHIKFEELYTDFQSKINEISERLLALGSIPIHYFEDYLTTSSIPPVKNIHEAQDCINFVIEGFKVLIQKQRTVLSLSEKLNDEESYALINHYIREQEKLISMY